MLLPASLLISLGALASIVLGSLILTLTVLGARSLSPDGKRRRVIAAAAVAILIQAWWVALIGVLFVKFVVLRQST